MAMALKELSASLRERKAIVFSELLLRHAEAERPASRPRSLGADCRETRSWETSFFRLEERFLRLDGDVAMLRQTLDSEVAALRHGLATMAEALHAVEAALQAEVEQQIARDSHAANLGGQIKDLRLDVTELLTLKLKPRLLALERDAGEMRRRLLSIRQPGTTGGEHTGCRRSPAADESEKAKKSLQEVGEALLERARRELQRQEEVAQSHVAQHRCIEASLDASSREFTAEARSSIQLAEQKAEALARDVARQVGRSAAEEQLDQALGTLREELSGLRGSAAEASLTWRAELAETKTSFTEADMQIRDQLHGLRGSLVEADGMLRDGLEDVRASSSEANKATSGLHRELEAFSSEVRGTQEEVLSLKRGSQEATATVREGFAKVQSLSTEAIAGLRKQLAETKTDLAEVEKSLQVDQAKALKLAGHAETEAQTAAQQNSRLAAGVRGVEETLERRMQWVATSNSELEASLGHAFAESHSALARTSRALAAEVVAERCRCAQTEEDVVARLRRFEDAVSGDSRLQADAVEQLNQAIAAAALRRQGEERNLLKKVQDALRSVEERRPLERRELVEAAGRAVAEARSDLLEELREAAQQDLRREMARLHREVREALQKEMGRLRQEYTTSVETQVRRGLAASESSGERRVEEMLRDHRTRERSEARVVANTAEAFCEEQAKAAAAKMEERAKLMALQAEEATRQLAQTMQDQATFAVKLAEATAQRCAARAEERAEELARKAQEDARNSFSVHLEDLLSTKLQAVESIQASVQTSVSGMEEATQSLAARCRAGELLAELAEGESSAAAQHARNAQELSADAQQSLGTSRMEWNEMRTELHAFVDEQRVFCGFLDTEQRSYHDLIRQEVTSLSRLVDTSLRIDHGLGPVLEGSPPSPAPFEAMEAVGQLGSMACGAPRSSFTDELRQS
ncbi:unnamed protein product [Symbiodinium natans]|uniref:Uncharacterized protein n=1 Tax=Symbiodinium natans TaxID=878477 RepID=A0A812RRH7_9DINO|nr:unnamed protein product [Symbiodinium natans]